MDQGIIAKSFAYKFVERIVAKGIGLVISIILARLLDPDAFGILAIISVFVNLAQTFVQGGLGTALVQNKTTEENDYSTVFFLSLTIAICLDLVLYVLAPCIAEIYGNDDLLWPLRIMALSLPFGSLNSIQNAKLQREMKFKRLMKCNLIATIVSGAIGIIAAYRGAELWALVFYNLAGIITVTICILIADKWYPRFVFSVTRAKVFWKFGYQMLISGLLCSLYADVRSLIVGKKFSTVDLAYYNRGQQFPEVIAHTLDNCVQTVMLPVMSAEQDSISRLNDFLLKSLSMSMFIVCPTMLGLAAIAQTLIPLLLTDKWSASIPLMVAFCISNLTFPIMTTNLSLIKALGRSDIYMRTEVVRRLVMIVVLLIAVFCFNSVMAIAISCVVSSVLDIWIIMSTVNKLTGLSWMCQMKCIGMILLSGVVMATIVYMINYLPCPALGRLCIQILLGIVIYAICVFAFRVESAKTLRKLIRRKD